MPQRLPQSMHLAARLQREWNRLAHQPHLVAAANRWGPPIPAVSSLDQLLRHAGYGWAGDEGSDAVLAALVRLAADDFVAARTVLQRILPGLAHAARRRGGNRPTPTAVAFDELVGCAWQLIRTYPIERRPRWVAANIVRDSTYHAFTRPARLRQHPQVPLGDLDRAVDGRIEPLLELIAFLRDATASGAEAADVSLIARLATTSVDAVASEMQVTDRTIRTRRAAALERLRALAA